MSNFIAGHHYVFDYIDINEIWISDQVPEEDRDKVILHEYIERGLMAQNYSYAKAHRAALKAEGLGKEEVEERSYITPDQIKKDLNKGFPNLSEKENEWDLGDRKIVLDETAGIIYVKDREKITDQKLIRSSEDIEKFIVKYKADKIEAD